jgi:GTPase SAR1 family protein
MIRKLQQIQETELDLPVWRYLTFPKFVSLVTYQALWFAKLNILQDQFEGTLPIPTEAYMRRDNEKWKEIFNSSEYHQQIDNWPNDNVSSGRELTVVNCWFLGENESREMWTRYVGSNDGVAICSSIRRLRSSVNAYHEFSLIGRVQYVDFDKHLMSMYEANQAPERALLKDQRFESEREIRIVSMSIKTPWCLNMDGSPLTKEQYTGKNMNNFENKGLYITVDLSSLIQFVVLAPEALDWFELLVKRVLKLFKLECPVIRSKLEAV